MKMLKSKLFLLLSLCVSCGSNNAQNDQSLRYSIATATTNGIAGNFSDQETLKFDKEKITTFFKKYAQLNSIRTELDSFYQHREYAFAWYDKKGLIEQASNLLVRIQNISTEGINNKVPYIFEFAGMIQTDNPDSINATTEIMLTAQYFSYAKNVWEGLSETATKGINWYIPRKRISSTLLLDSLLNGNDVLNSPPIYRQYNLLKDQLQKYQDIKKSGGFPIINSLKKNLKKGDSSAIISQIARWLSIAGDLRTGAISNVLNDELITSIKKFQVRSGLTVDGNINIALINEMNVPIDTRLQQIMLNMERSRWVPVNVSTDYLVVNIPEFKLHAYENDSLLWSMDAVVGKPVHNTVIFSGLIRYVVFSPYWNVPPSILKNEILPAIRRNKNYLASQNMEWYNGQVRQRSGPRNALGLVKFLFPNSYNIYLHDTPSKSLFSNSTRAFSHGCIRLSDAEKLANYLLKGEEVWTAGKINTAMHRGKEESVTLKKSEMVFIVYFTSWVDSGGNLNFRNDLYKRDKRLAGMLLENNVL